jgi:hypothetical protein
MVEKPSKFQPALVGGLVLGILSVIPIVSIGNLCCCLWVLLGGALAARMLVTRSSYLPITYGDGAGVGAFAGLVGSAILLVIGVPIQLLLRGGQDFEMAGRMWGSDPEVMKMLETMQENPAIFALIVWVVQSIITVGFAAIGGLIGVALFEKRKGQAPPPPPSWPPQPGPQQGPPPSQPPYGGGGSEPPFGAPPSGNPPQGGQPPY